jgi:hypothetical protein
MSGREKNIDRIFKNKLRNFDAEPPVEVWESIRERLYLNRRRKMIYWSARVAAGIAVLAVLSITYFKTRDLINDNLVSDDLKLKKEAREGVLLKEGEVSEGEVSEGEVSEGEVSEGEVLKGDLAEGDLSGEKLPERKVSGTNGFLAASLQGQEMVFVSGKSIGRLDYEIPVREIGLLRSGKHDETFKRSEIPEGIPDEDIYTLNIPSDDESTKNRWAIGTQVSPLYSYRSLVVQDESLETANYYNQAESGTFAYSGGVHVNYSPTRRISFQSGVYYSKYGVTVDQAYLFENQLTADVTRTTKFYSVNNSSGTINIADKPSVDYVTNYGQRKNQNMNSGTFDEFSMEVNSGEVIQNFNYIEVPLVFRYRLIDRKIGFNFLGGLSTNLLVGSNTYYNDNGNKEKIGETTDIKLFSYSSIMGVGIDYALSERLNLNLEPTFRYYLNSINESSYIGSHPYSIGVFTGLRYSF